MRVLPEDERLRTLEILAENRQDVEEKLLALPIAKDGTPVVHRRKAELEARLAEIRRRAAHLRAIHRPSSSVSNKRV